MQLEELKTFIAIIESGSLVKASAKLNVTQSTVTARLKSLEAEVGQVLIKRAKSGATLTAAGVRLQRYATTITNLWGQARREIALPDGFQSLCNFGCHVDLWAETGVAIFDIIRQSESAAIAVSTGHDDELIAWLQSGQIDLALVYRPPIQPNLMNFPLKEEKLILVSTRADSPVRFDPDYVFVEAGEEFGAQHAAAYADADTARISFNTACMGLEYLLQHGGSAYLPQRLVSKAISKQQLFALADAPVFTRNVYLICNRDAQTSWPWFDACLTMQT